MEVALGKFGARRQVYCLFISCQEAKGLNSGSDTLCRLPAATMVTAITNICLTFSHSDARGSQLLEPLKYDVYVIVLSCFI